MQGSKKELGVHGWKGGGQMVMIDSTVTHTPLSELLEWNAIREALSADPDSLQNSITPQLV